MSNEGVIRNCWWSWRRCPCRKCGNVRTEEIQDLEPEREIYEEQTNGLNEELKDAAEEVVVDKENDDSNQGISSSEIVN